MDDGCCRSHFLARGFPRKWRQANRCRAFAHEGPNDCGGAGFDCEKVWDPVSGPAASRHLAQRALQQTPTRAQGLQNHSMTRFILIALLIATPAVAGDITGIPRIMDGDTVEIENTKIRLSGIDAPETHPMQFCLGPAGEKWD